MEPKDFKDVLETIYSTTNENGELSKLLTKIYDAFNDKHVEKLEADKQKEEITTQNNSLTDVNEQLRGVNMDLFLKVGSIKKETESPTPPEDNTIPLTELYG